MNSKNYYSNIPPKNVLREEDNPKNLSEEILFNSKDFSLDNMILNSNLDNQNNIK